MSQFPPNPQGNFPPGNFPPGNYPPHMQPPYGGGMYQPPMQPRTSGAAITSLIMGILLCVPFVTGICAILFGIIGLISARKPYVRGKGMSIVGLVLGILGIVLWSSGVGLYCFAYSSTGPERALAQSFTQNLASGNTTAAQAQCTSAVLPAKVDAASVQLSSMGTMSGFSVIFAMPTSVNGAQGAMVEGMARFGNVTKVIVITVQHTKGGQVQVADWMIQ